MLILLALVVVGLSALLWWMKDSTLFEKRVKTREPFQDRALNEDESLAAGYSALPGELQQEAKATEIITPQLIEANYLAVAEQRDAEIRRNEIEIQQTVDRVTAIDPRVSLEARIQEVNTNPQQLAEVARETANTNQVAFQQLLESTEAGARDTCFQQSCIPIQSAMGAKCAEFSELCKYGLNYDVQKCISAATDNCRPERVNECRTKCDRGIREANRKTTLNQGDILTTNQRLQSVSGSTVMILRDTGNLELYDGGVLIWSSRTNTGGGASTINQNPYKLMIYPNGDMVIKNALQIDVWHTNTWMDVFKAGTENGPFRCVVGEKMIALINRSGNIIWNSKSS